MRKDKLETRKKILNAASALFCRVGFEGTHFDDLAEFAGVSRKTLYNHFPSKDDLLIDILEPIFTEGIETLNTVKSASFEFEDILNIFARLWEKYRCCFELLNCYKIKELTILKEKQEHFIATIKEAFNQLTDKGLVFPLGIGVSLLIFSSIVVEVLTALQDETNRQLLFREVMKGALGL